MQKRWYLFLLLLLALAITACGGNAAADSGTALDFPNYWHITVAQVTSQATAQDTANVPAGQRLVALQITATNIQQSDPDGNGSQIHTADFRLYDATNQAMPPQTLYDVPTTDNFPGGSIAPGQTASITIYYQIPMGSATYELDFQLHAINTGTHAQAHIHITAA